MPRSNAMDHHIYKTIELTGSSPQGIEDAIRSAIGKASQTIHNLRWFEVTQMRGHVDKDTVAHWQVTLKVGFSLDE
jgi:flavin-binding protein dodecin